MKRRVSLPKHSGKQGMSCPRCVLDAEWLARLTWKFRSEAEPGEDYEEFVKELEKHKHDYLDYIFDTRIKKSHKQQITIQLKAEPRPQRPH